MLTCPNWGIAPGEGCFDGCSQGKLLSPQRQRAAFAATVGKYPKLSKRRACLILGVPRSTIRYQEVPQADETPLRYSVLAVANLYGRYGYRTVFDLLAAAGW